jgi:hypothetical protein
LDGVPGAERTVVRTAVSIVLPNFAEIVEVRGKGTEAVVIVKFAETWPAATVTDEGTRPTRT